MQAGRLRHRLRIEANNPTRDEFNAPVDNWVEFATVWAAIEPMTGNERWIQSLGVEIGQANTRIRIRYREGVTTAMRGLHRNQVYDFEHVANRYTMDREIWLFCTQRAVVLPEGEENGTC